MFITLDGFRGSGTTTQSQLLHDYLCELSVPALLVREDGTYLGKHLKHVMEDMTRLDPDVREMLNFAARSQMIETTVRPALDSGFIVICTRYIDAESSQHHEAKRRSTDKHALRGLSSKGIMPDLSIYLAVSYDQIVHRLLGKHAHHEEDTGHTSLAKNAKYVEGMQNAIAECPSCWTVVDGNEQASTVCVHIRAIVRTHKSYPFPLIFA